MEFGLFSQGERNNKIAARTYDEDLFEVVTADKLGFNEAWITEHLGRTTGARPDTVPCVELMLAKASAMTKQIRLGPGIRPIAFYQPVQVAIEAAMVDHLLGGRYMFGFGVGGPGADAMHQRGLGEDKTRRPRMHEALDLILKCWTTDDPFDYEGEFFRGTGINTQPKPLQKPYPPIGAAASRTHGTADLAGRNGFMLLTSQYDAPDHIHELANIYVEAQKQAGRRPSRSAVRCGRYVYLSDSVKKAKEEIRAAITPSIERHKRFFPHHYRLFPPPSGDVMDVTFDHLVEAGHLFVGDPDTVAGRIRELYDETGGFGTFLIVCGKDFGSRQQRARSFRMFKQYVAPQLADLDPDRKAELDPPPA